MLVLGRKQDQKVCFPDLGVTVHVLRVNRSSVRLGIDAPLEVRVVREELDKEPSSAMGPHDKVVRLPKAQRHQLRNELNLLSIATHLFKKETDAGLHADAEVTFNRIIEQLDRIGAHRALSCESAAKSENHRPSALLVEDQPNEREMLAGFLRLQGHQVATVGDGLEAINYLASHEKPSFVLIDMRMPRCDGPTTIRRIRENRALDDVKIFAVSGSTPEESCLEVGKDRIDGWFMKPLNPDALVHALAASKGTAA